MSDMQLNLDNIDLLNTNNSLHEFFHIIQNFGKRNIKEIEPTTKNIIFEGDLSIVINESVNLIFKELNKGEDRKIIKQHILNYINNHKIILQEVYNWLLNNQNNSNSIYLLGYFNYHGIETIINKQKAFELYQKASELENSVAQLDLADMYIYGKGVDKDYNKAFELYKKSAEYEHSYGIIGLGYCYFNGIGTSINKQKAFELYQKAADLGNNVAQHNLALMYQHGNWN